MTFPKIGNIAPAFDLLNQKNESIKLKDYKDKKIVVLYFYPKAMTPGCTVQAKGITKSKRKFSANNIVVFGVSPDSPERLQKFETRDSLNFNLLSDPEHKVADKYGVWGEKKFMGRTYDGIHRMTFIIDIDGKLKHIFQKVNTKTHDEDVLMWIKENLK